MTIELRQLYGDLGIPPDYPRIRGLTIHEEAETLVFVDGCDGPYRVTPETAAAWERMNDAAGAAGIEMFLVSGFRSYAYQAELLAAKLSMGIAVMDALTVVAPPGCSEHHTGRAVDLGTPDSEALEEDFEETDAFVWLTEHASRFGFRMSYPRGNASGFIYEPWHWCFSL